MEKLDYLRRLKMNETEKLENLCETWNVISFEDVPEEECGKILSVLGQAKLLIKEKFVQFNKLLNSYETNEDQNMTIEDLEGFWDLISIQIEDILNKFQNLEKLKSNAWVPIPQKVNLRKRVMKKETKKIILTAEQCEQAKNRLAEAKAQFKSNLKGNLDTFLI